MEEAKQIIKDKINRLTTLIERGDDDPGFILVAKIKRSALEEVLSEMM